MSKEREAILALMRALNRINCVYFESGKHFEIGDIELWIMYALSEGVPLSQKQIHDEWRIPRTTINAVVKKWEEKGWVTLTPIPGKRREMTVSFTKTGKRRSDALLRKLFRMEENAMAAALSRYSARFIEGVRFFEQKLREEYEKGFLSGSDPDKTNVNRGPSSGTKRG